VNGDDPTIFFGRGSFSCTTCAFPEACADAKCHCTPWRNTGDRADPFDNPCTHWVGWVRSHSKCSGRAGPTHHLETDSLGHSHWPEAHANNEDTRRIPNIASVKHTHSHRHSVILSHMKNLCVKYVYECYTCGDFIARGTFVGKRSVLMQIYRVEHMFAR